MELKSDTHFPNTMNRNQGRTYALTLTSVLLKLQNEKNSTQTLTIWKHHHELPLVKEELELGCAIEIPEWKPLIFKDLGQLCYWNSQMKGAQLRPL